MAEIPNPPIDYLSRDYASLRADMIDGIPTRVPEWTSRNQNDFGIALIELFAYMGDGLHYYADRIANEAFLQTATQRSSVLSFARLLDYLPAGNQAATVPLVFANGTAEIQTIPRGTRVSTPTTDAGQRTVYFETTTDLLVPVGGQAAVDAVEGITVPVELIGTSNGAFDQSFVLRETPVIDGSVVVSVSETTGVIWTYYEHLIDADPQTPAYTLRTDESGRVSVVFGDNVNGKVPAPGAPIRAMYRVGGGSIGNVGPGQLTRIVTTIAPGVTVTNQASATGGADAETLAQIKVNAPRSLYSLRRAVTLDDYANLVVEINEIGKAQAVSTTPNSVVIYVVPRAGGPLTTELRQRVLDYLEPLKPAPVTVSVIGPTYVPTNITIRVEVLPQYQRERVRQSVQKQVADILSLDNVILGDRLRLVDLYALLVPIEGVSTIAVDVLERLGDDPEPGSPDAVFRNHEVPIVGDVAVTATGGIGL